MFERCHDPKRHTDSRHVGCISDKFSPFPRPKLWFLHPKRTYALRTYFSPDGPLRSGVRRQVFPFGHFGTAFLSAVIAFRGEGSSISNNLGPRVRSQLLLQPVSEALATGYAPSETLLFATCGLPR